MEFNEIIDYIIVYNTKIIEVAGFFDKNNII